MILVACISCGPITINFRDGCYDLLLIYYNTITGRDQFGTKTSKITNHQYQFGTDTNIYCKNDLFSVRDREFRDRDCHVWKQHYSTCKHRFVLRDWDRVVYLILVTQRNIWEICWLVCPVYVSWAELWMCVGKKSNYPIICFIRVSKHPSAQYCPPLCLPATQVEEVEAFPPSHLIDSSCNLYNFLLLLSSPHIYQLLLYTLFHIKIDSSYYSQTFSRLEHPNIERKDVFLSN